MEKDLSDEAPPFAQLIDDVSKTMASCGLPNRTYSMMDEYTARNSAQFWAQFSHRPCATPLRYTADMERDGCYVNPFVGEGRYARYLRNWLDIVPKRQILLVNFDEWTEDAATTMRAVADFLNLAPFTFRVEEAHNTHKSRSVHVEKEGHSNAAELMAAAAIDDALGFGTYCILHEFFRPYNAALDELLAEYAYPPMRWSSGRKGDLACPDEYKYWKDVRGGAGDQVLETHQSEFFGDIDMKELDKEKKKKHSKKKSS